MKKEKKRIPHFKNENKEREFWANHDITDYIDVSKTKRVIFPKLKPTLFKGNKGLLNKKRFEKMEEEKIKHLKNLSLEKSIKMMESLLASKIVYELKDNFLPDNPLSLKLGLKARKDAVRRGL